MPHVDRTATVAQIALDHPACVHVFRAHRIDFCCRGGLTVEQACAGKGLDANSVFEQLEAAVLERQPPAEDPRHLTTQRLVQHIVDRHHAYLRKALPFVEQLARKVARVHGAHDARLAPLADVVSELGETLLEHIDEEERTLFPALLAGAPDRARIEGELRSMHDEHVHVGDLLSRIRTLAGDFALAPEWACASYRTLMRELEEIESDTFTHVHQENHVLVPRFAPMEASA